MTAIIVLAKAPVAGYAKTRLIGALGAHGAAALAQRLLDHAIEQALAARLGDVELCCAPDPDHAAFARHGARVELSAQGDGDLGARMARAFERRLAVADRALLIGTDAPALDAQRLRRAAAAFDDARIDAVLIPALDGGYALVGLRRPAPELFERMAWSTPTVLARTRERLAALRMRHVELDAVADVDEAADLARLPAGWVEP